MPRKRREDASASAQNPDSTNPVAPRPPASVKLPRMKSPRMAVSGVRVTPEMLAALNAISATSGLPVAHLIVNAVDEYIAHRAGYYAPAAHAAEVAALVAALPEADEDGDEDDSDEGDDSDGE